MYSKEQIETLRNDPFVKLVSFLLNDPEALDKAIEEVEAENAKKDKQPVSKTPCTTTEDNFIPIINKDVYNAILDQVFLYKKNIHDLNDLGFTFDPGVMKNINHPLLNIICLLFTSIWNDEFTSSFINLLFDDKACRNDFEELYKIYCE